MCWPLRAPRLPPPRLEPPRDALKERPSGGRAEKGLGVLARGADVALECGRELPDVLGRELEYERADESPDSRLGRGLAVGREDELEDGRAE